MRPSPLTRLRTPLAAAALALAGAAGACDRAEGHAGIGHQGAAVLADSPAAPARPVPGGRFRVAYAPVSDTVFAHWQDDFRRDRFLEDIADWLNGWVGLPADVTLTFAQCGESNAFYREENRTVTLCYELVDELDHSFEGEDDAEQSVDDALLFTTLHEVGHALVNVLHLPVTGREEDAVDQLAALVLVDGNEDGDVAAVNGVRALPDDEDQMDDLAFADEHALSGQRFYNVLCLVYGQDPDAHADWVEQGTLPAERAERCPAEYQRTLDAWNKLLAPYLKS